MDRLSAKEPFHILLVEDDRDDYLIAERLLSKIDHSPVSLDWEQTVESGLSALTSKKYDAALIDYRLGPDNGLNLIREATRAGVATPLILLTGQAGEDVDLEAMRAGAEDYLVKWDFSARNLARTIRYARERQHAEQRIREQAALLDKARDSIYHIDLDGQIIYCNESAVRDTGWTSEEICSMNIQEGLQGGNGATLENAFKRVAERDEWTGELRQSTREGEEKIVESRWTLVRDSVGEPKSILIINTDVTERKKLEAQFLRAQRMESVGRLVSGIAHDLGNLLVPITLGVRVLRQRYSDDERVMHTCRMIENSAQRGADMVEQVLSIARGHQGEQALMTPLDVVHEVRQMVEETFPSSIEVRSEITDELWSVVGDSTQLQQVLMNLCVNARDAMPEGGTLTLKADNIDMDERSAQRYLEAKPIPYVCISVADNGEGIPREVQDKIFEPFFSTKPEGEGTGLGLASVYSIVKNHGGFIALRSEQGVGSTFRVFIPAAEEDVEHRVQQPLQTNGRTRGDEEVILIVDDDETILEVMSETLEEDGFQVITATGGAKALEILEQKGDELDLLLTDLMMPDVDGLKVIETTRERLPQLPIVATSGIMGAPRDDAIEAGADIFIPKPFTAGTLCDTVASALNRQEA